MGNGQALLGFNAYFKHQLNWLPETAIQTITSNGVYRLYPSDVSTLDNAAAYALKIETGTGRDYWIEGRQQFTTTSWPPASVLVYWSPWAQSAGGDQLLDMNPGGSGGFYDAGLALGETLRDVRCEVSAAGDGLRDDHLAAVLLGQRLEPRIEFRIVVARHAPAQDLLHDR
jgi:hypothetical protein